MKLLQELSEQELGVIREAYHKTGQLNSTQLHQLGGVAQAVAVAALMVSPCHEPPMVNDEGVVWGGTRDRVSQLLGVSEHRSKQVIESMQALGLLTEAGYRKLRLELPEELMHLLEASEADEPEENADSPRPNCDVIERASRRAHAAQRGATMADLALDLITGMKVTADQLPSIIEELISVLKSVGPDDLALFVSALQDVLEEQTDNH